MKKALLAAVSAAALITVPTLAQAADGKPISGWQHQGEQAAQAAGPAPAATADSQPMFLTTEASSNTLSDKYIGASIKTGPGEDAETVGKISELIFDDQDRIVAVVADVGGFLGVGGKTIAIGWEHLEKSPADDEIVFTTLLSRKEIEGAPEFVSLQEQRDAAEREARRSGTSGSRPLR